MDKNIKDLQILLTEKQIQAKIKELAEQIDAKFNNDDTLYLICVLKGSVLFTCDLAKHLKSLVQLEFIRISSYGNEQKSTNKLKAIDLTLPDLRGKNVVIVEDIVDTGFTAKFLKNLIKYEHEATNVMFVSLLNKKCARQAEIEPDLYGFDVDDKFVVGYGLDYLGYYRNLPYIGFFPN